MSARVKPTKRALADNVFLEADEEDCDPLDPTELTLLDRNRILFVCF